MKDWQIEIMMVELGYQLPKHQREMKEGTLVWALAEVSEFQKNNNREGTIIVEPMGYKALPYYANVENIKEVPLWEIDEIDKRYDNL